MEDAGDDGGPILLTPGPTIVHRSVREALAGPQLAHNSPEFLEAMRGMPAMLRDVLASHDVRLALMTGSGTVGIEAVAASLLSRSDSALAVESGFFGERMADILKLYAGDVDVISAPPGRLVPPDAVEDALRGKRYRALFAVHVDTSTGLLTPLDRLAEVAHENGALMAVDGVSSVGGVRFEMDALGVDVLMTSSQKCLAAPPGVSIVALSDQAYRSLRRPPSFYLDVGKWIEVAENPGKYRATPAVNLYMALAKALELVLDEGMEARWRRHEEQASFLRSEMLARGFHVLAENPSPTVSVFDVSQAGLDPSAVREEIYRSSRIWIAVGTGDFRATHIRIGHMGNVRLGHLRSFLGALDDYLSGLRSGSSASRTRS